MKKVPLKWIKCGNLLKKQSECFLLMPERKQLEFHCQSEKDGDFRIHCINITAIDLQVETKFGCIDAMDGTLLIECSAYQEIVNKNSTTSETFLNFSTAKNSLVTAKFHVNETGAVRDVIRKLRSIYSSLESDENSDNIDQNERRTNPKQFKEGLPAWVQFIPHYLYSRTTRKCLQFAIHVYMAFSVMWALWQLYRHVKCIREFVRPIIDTLQYQYKLLDYTIRFFSTIFEQYTVQWLCFLKPLYTVLAATSEPLLQTVSQLGPLFKTIGQIAKPFSNIGYQLVYLVFIVIRGFKSTVAKLCPLFNASVLSTIGGYFKAVTRMVWVTWQRLGQAHIDPLAAQLVVVRTTVIQSSKVIGLGMVRLARKIHKLVWLRRSARVEKQK